MDELVTLNFWRRPEAHIAVSRSSNWSRLYSPHLDFFLLEVHNEKQEKVLFSFPFSPPGPDARLYPALLHSVISFTIFNVKNTYFLLWKANFVAYATSNMQPFPLAITLFWSRIWICSPDECLMLFCPSSCSSSTSIVTVSKKKVLHVCYWSPSVVCARSLSILVSSLFLLRRGGTVTWFPGGQRWMYHSRVSSDLLWTVVFVIMSWFHCERACQWWDDCM